MIEGNLWEIGERICEVLWSKGNIQSDYTIEYHPTRLLIVAGKNILGYVSKIEGKRKWEPVTVIFKNIRARELGIRLSLFHPFEPL